jgi:hypothetical protein
MVLDMKNVADFVHRHLHSERMYMRRELDQFFSTLPTIADRFQTKAWRTGPKHSQTSCRRRPRA